MTFTRSTPIPSAVTLRREPGSRDYLEFIDELGVHYKIELNSDGRVFRIWYTHPDTGMEVMVRLPASSADAAPDPDSFEDEEDRALGQILYDQYREGQLMEPGYVVRAIRKLGWKPSSEANREATVARVEKIKARNERDATVQENTDLHAKVSEGNAEIKKLKTEAMNKDKRIRELEHQLAAAGGPKVPPIVPYGPPVGPPIYPHTPYVGAPLPNSTGPTWISYTTNNTKTNDEIAREALKRLKHRET